MPSDEQVLTAARAVATVDGIVSHPLSGSSYHRRLVSRMRDTEGAPGEALAAAVDRLAVATEATALPFGSWHGDWAPWNMAADGDQVLVWDLERYETDVPVGMDLIHSDLGTRILVPDRDPTDVVARRRERAAALLAPLGVTAEAAPIVFALYLLDVATRWLSDGQADAGVGHTVVDGVVSAALAAVDDIVARPATGLDPDLAVES